MKIDLAHICYDIQTIDLPEKCPGCGQVLSDKTVQKYYFVESAVYNGTPDPRPKPKHNDLLLMVQCTKEGCHHILAHANPAETEAFSSLDFIKVELLNFLNPRTMTS